MRAKRNQGICFLVAALPRASLAVREASDVRGESYDDTPAVSRRRKRAQRGGRLQGVAPTTQTNAETISPPRADMREQRAVALTYLAKNGS